MNLTSTKASSSDTSLTPDQPMSHFVRILARGKLGSRNFTQAEAFDAMTHVLTGSATDIQIGALLMLLRVKEETSEELTGFVLAVKAELAVRFGGELKLSADLDWPSYAGKRRHHAWYLLAALTLSAHGVRVFMHGARGHTEGRVYSEDLLSELGLEPATSFAQVKDNLDRCCFSFMPTRTFSPVLSRLIDLRTEFGVRSPVHTLLRLVNPLDADHTLQSIFHPAYQASHRSAALSLGYANSVVIKGDGGEFERNPDARTRVLGVRDHAPFDMKLEMQNDTRSEVETDLSAATLRAVWLDQTAHPYGDQAIHETLALALINLKKANTYEQAKRLAASMWSNRSSAPYFNQLIRPI